MKKLESTGRTLSEGKANVGKGSRLESELLALEPRILFDGAAVATGIEAAADMADHAVDLQHQQEQAHDALLSALAGEELSDGVPQDNVRGIVFIDSAVDDIDSLVAGISDGYDVYIIEAGSDGVEQIASVMADRRDVQSLHIISHGRSGTLDLGSTKLTEASMPASGLSGEQMRHRSRTSFRNWQTVASQPIRNFCKL